jgi:hypothetical protein
LARQAAVLDAEKGRKLRVAARVRTANIASRTATTGGSAESPYRFDNQAVASSLKGAEAFLAETGGISAELRTSASRIRGISNETPGLGSLLLGGLAGVAGTSAFAQVEGADSFWGDSGDSSGGSSSKALAWDAYAPEVGSQLPKARWGVF